MLLHAANRNCYKSCFLIYSSLSLSCQPRPHLSRTYLAVSQVFSTLGNAIAAIQCESHSLIGTDVLWLMHSASAYSVLTILHQRTHEKSISMATASEFNEPPLHRNQRLMTLALREGRMEKRLLICNPRTSFASVSSRESDLRTLNRFPVEVMFQIFSELDFTSLISLRKTNVQGCQLVSAYLPFEVSMVHASAALRAIQCVGSLKHVNAFEFFALMRSSKCSRCGNLGPFMFIPTIERTCWSCIEKFRVYKVSTIKTCFDLEDAHFEGGKTFKTFPGKYGEPWRTFIVIHHLILESKTKDVQLIAGNGSMKRANKRKLKVIASFQRIYRRWEEKIIKYNQSPNRHLTLPPREPATWHDRMDEYTRQYNYLLTTTMPFIDVPARTIQAHRYCAGCNYERYLFRTRFKNLMPLTIGSQMEVQTLHQASRAWLIKDLEEHICGCLWSRLLEQRGAITTFFRCV